MQHRNIINGEHELTKDRWILSFVRRIWDAHGYLIIEGLDKNGSPIRRRAELGYLEIGINKNGRKVYDETRGQIHCYDLLAEKIESMRKEQDKYVCKTFIIDENKKKRLDAKIFEDQNKEIAYNVGGATKSSGFFGASLEASGSHEIKADLTLRTLDRVREDKWSAHSSLAILKPGHNCVSWAEEAIYVADPALDLKTKLAKYVVAIPQVEIGTKCIIL